MYDIITKAKHGIDCLALIILSGLMPTIAFAAGVAPGSGDILQQLQQPKAVEPFTQEPGLQIPETQESRIESNVSFLVKEIKVRGNTLFDSATLRALVANAEGETQTLTQLQQVASRITDYYHSHGYPLSRAILPAQTIHDGIVEFRVLEARYGNIDVKNSSRVKDSLLKTSLSSLEAGQIIGEQELNHSLLLLSDVPGVKSSAALQPGQTVGTSDLEVNVEPTPFITGNVMLDNYGNDTTGRAQMQENFTVFSPAHHGDTFSGNFMVSSGGLSYSKMTYDYLTSGQGTHLGVSHSSLSYVLGGSFAYAQGHGSADVLSFWLKQTIMRSVDSNVYDSLQYDKKQLRDHLDAAAIYTDRHLRNLTASLNGNVRDGLFTGGYNAWSVAFTAGRIVFDDAAAKQADAGTVASPGLNTAGNFGKWNLSATRIQHVSERDSLYLSVSGQWANKNLDSSEKLVGGGPYSVRAYDMGVISGDSGYMGTVELRHRLGQRWQVKAFFDDEQITVNNTPVKSGPNCATLGGAGIGLDWSKGAEYVRIYVAERVGTAPTLLSNSPTARGWFELGTSF